MPDKETKPTKGTQWPELKLARYRGGEKVWIDHGPESESAETETYVPLQQAREDWERELLSDEAVEASARSTWNINGRLKGDPDWSSKYPPDRDTWMDEARRDLQAALAATKEPNQGGER